MPAVTALAAMSPDESKSRARRLDGFQKEVAPSLEKLEVRIELPVLVATSVEPHLNKVTPSGDDPPTLSTFD